MRDPDQRFTSINRAALADESVIKSDGKQKKNPDSSVAEDDAVGHVLFAGDWHRTDSVTGIWCLDSVGPFVDEADIV